MTQTTISSRQASREAKRLWERLHTVLKNEEAWAVIDDELDNLRNPCRCHVSRRYRLDQGEYDCREERR